MLLVRITALTFGGRYIFGFSAVTAERFWGEVIKAVGLAVAAGGGHPGRCRAPLPLAAAAVTTTSVPCCARAKDKDFLTRLRRRRHSRLNQR